MRAGLHIRETPMQTIKHGHGGPDIVGIRLMPGTIINEGDVYNSTTGKWEANSLHVGGKVPAGDHVIWVRPAIRREGMFSPEARATADAFLEHKKAHPEPVPYEQLSPIQKRMQSGDI